jgi:hypothetical protein
LNSVFLTCVGFAVVFGGPGVLSFVSFAGIEMGALNQRLISFPSELRLIQANTYLGSDETK